MRVIRLETIDSTMLEARRLLAVGEAMPFVVVADEQTGGVGRLGRGWSSPRGGLWFTLAALAPTVDPILSLRAALNVHAVCTQLAEPDYAAGTPRPDRPPRLHIKWPNDVVHVSDAGPKKVAGILIERLPGPPGSPGSSTVLCGVGINVNNSVGSLPAEVAARAVSLAELRGGPVGAAEWPDAVEWLAELIEQRVSTPQYFERADVLRAFKEFLWKPHADVPITLPDGTRVRGRVEGLNDDGDLLATIDGEVRTLRSVDQLG